MYVNPNMTALILTGVHGIEVSRPCNGDMSKHLVDHFVYTRIVFIIGKVGQTDMGPVFVQDQFFLCDDCCEIIAREVKEQAAHVVITDTRFADWN